MSNLKKTINEDIEHMSSWKDDNNEEVVFTILKNPTKKEFRDLLNHSKYKQLRGLCSVNSDSNLYVWDASYGTHDSVFQKYIIKNEKNWDGNYVNIMFRPKDYDIWGFTFSNWFERLGYKETDNSTNGIPTSKWNDIFNDDDLGLLDESVQYNSEVIKNPSIHDWRKITHSNDDYRVVMNDKDMAVSKAFDDLHEYIANESDIKNFYKGFTYQGKLYLEEDDTFIRDYMDIIIENAQRIYNLEPYKKYFNNGIYVSLEDVKNNKPIKEKTMTETVNFDLKLQLNDKWKYGSSINEIKSYIKKTITETFGNSYLSTNKQDNKTFNDLMTIHCITNKIPTDKLPSIYNKIKMLESKGFTCKSDLAINVYNAKYNLQDYIWEQCNLALNKNHYNCEKQLMTNKKQMFVEQLSNELKANNYSNIKTLINNNKELIETFIRNNKKTIIIENFNNISREDLLKLGVTLKNIQESSKFKKSYIIKESIDGMNKESFMTILF